MSLLYIFHTVPFQILDMQTLLIHSFDGSYPVVITVSFSDDDISSTTGLQEILEATLLSISEGLNIAFSQLVRFGMFTDIS